VYGGQRAREFELRLGGASYEEIARAGGGIRSTVAATREASDAALFAAEPLTLQSDGADALRVPPFALAWSDDGRSGVWRIVADTPVRAWWIHFEPNA